MFLTLILMLALAVYGGYSAMAPQSPEGVSGAYPPGSNEAGLLNAVQLYAMEAAASGLNISMEDIPSTGCGPSLLDPQKVYELVISMPEPQRSALAQALSSGADVWTAQLYSDEDRVGLCLPMQGKLVAFPVAEKAPFLSSILNYVRTLLTSY